MRERVCVSEYDSAGTAWMADRVDDQRAVEVGQGQAPSSHDDGSRWHQRRLVSRLSLQLLQGIRRTRRRCWLDEYSHSDYCSGKQCGAIQCASAGHPTPEVEILEGVS